MTPDSQRRKSTEQLALVAERLPDLFQAPLPYAPGVYFCGAMVCAKEMGIADHASGPVGVAGRGLNQQQAFESCVGEACEYLSRIEWKNDPLVVSCPADVGLTERALEWALDGIGLSAANMSPRELDWIAATSLLDGEGAFFPAELIVKRTKATQVGSRPAESNGVATGKTQAEALHSAIMEVIERDAIALWWFGGQEAIRVSDTSLERLGVNQLARSVRRDRARHWWMLDITSDIGVPTFAALSSDLDGRRIVGGFCARQDPAESVQGAFLEMCQMELAQEIALRRSKMRGRENIGEMDAVWFERSEALNAIDYPELTGREGDRCFPPAELDDTVTEVAGMLGELGYTPYWVDLFRSDIGVPVVRAVVPGLQSIKPDWISRRLREVATRNSISLTDIRAKPSLI